LIQDETAKIDRKSGPLEGIRILDLTTVMLGPYATQILGDYGADVIKIESPDGDSTRTTGPTIEPGMAATFIGVNRSKRSIVLDLKQAAAREVLLDLTETADVLIYNMRPQKMASLGLTPESLRKKNKNLIVVAIHGFSEEGPYAGRPAYDDIIQGLCGLASLSQLQGHEPAYLPTVVADKTCALFASQAVLMALVARARTGEGAYVEVPMFEAMVNFTLVEHFYGAHFSPPVGDSGYTRLLTASRRPYRTSDGYVCIIPYGDHHWRRFFTETGQAELMDDVRFSTMTERTHNIDALYSLLAETVKQRSTFDWLATCERLDIPAAPLNRLRDLQNDPHLLAIGFFQTVNDERMGNLVMPGPPLRFDGVVVPPNVPPRMGEHTVEVLRDAGFPQSRIQNLLNLGAAVDAKAVQSL
jgi:crotonobetainyl-CoA:carnitine CoA-transferase CaiB-like acyl-CoA transferase